LGVCTQRFGFLGDLPGNPLEVCLLGVRQIQPGCKQGRLT
jgi:hypothetical protein